MNKSIKWLIGLVLIVLAGFLFFYRMYHRDVKALRDFSAAYEKFDKAVSDLSKALLAPSPGGGSVADDLQRKAEAAFAELKSKASVRISSLIRNDAEFMSLAREIADLAGRELAALKSYKKSAPVQDVDFDRLRKEFGDLADTRQTVYARLRRLGGLND